MPMSYIWASRAFQYRRGRAEEITMWPANLAEPAAW